jgi:hypothetical protein
VIHDLRAEAKRRQLLIERREAHVVEAERRLSIARYQEKRSILETKLEREAESAKTVASLLAKLASAAPELRQRRAEVDAALHEAEKLRPADLAFEWPKLDEPEWPERHQLRAVFDLIEGGPRRPRADAEHARQEREAQRRQSEEANLRQAVEFDLSVPERLLGQDEFPSAVARLPEHLRGEGEKLVAKGRKKQREVQRRNREQHAPLRV